MTAGIILGFVLSAAAVILAGVVLARAGDVIAARTKLGRVWFGTVFLAAATSLPELVTDVAAVRLGAADLAVGDLFGSNMANMLILALVSLAPGRELFRKATLDNALGAAFAIALTSTAAVGVLLRPATEFAGLGPTTALLILLYLSGTYLLFRHSRLPREAGRVVETVPEPDATTPPEAAASLRPSVLRFIAASAVILVAAPLFAVSAKGIAEVTGLHQGFVGAWLVGFATSLPELVTSLAAVRIQAHDLAVGNLFGSNAFNMMLLGPLDLAATGGPLFAGLHPVHAVSALVSILLMAIGLAALVYRAKGRIGLLEPASAIMLVVYILGLVVVYAASVMA